MPKHEQARARQSGGRSATESVPGLWAALVIVGVSAIGTGWWAKAGEEAPGAPAVADGSRIAEVVPKDLPAALGTLQATPEQLARFQAQGTCKARLAWVTIVRSPGQPNGRIRLQSGQYFTPAFTLTDVPVRVALPYPAPYATGRGTISVQGATADAIVALMPPWHVSAQGGVRAQEVTWTPIGACSAVGR